MNRQRLLLGVLGFILPIMTGKSNEASDASRTALVSLCDPAKIATLSSERGANPRVRKIAYWLEIARREGRDSKAEMEAVMSQYGWGKTLKGELTAMAMVRNRTIAERLGCLDEEGMEKLRRGSSPTVKFGPYSGEKLTVDHIIPRAVSPSLDLVLANLELLPHSLNLRKGAKIGQRQVDLANKLLQAGLLSADEHSRVLARRTPGFESP
jgi:hypothetical protein